MNIIVFIVGLLIAIIGFLFVFTPRSIKIFLEKFLDKKWMLWAIIFRLVIGISFILAQSETRYPQFILWLGILTLLSAITLPIVGKERVGNLIKWWLNLPTVVTIIWAFIACLFGLLIMYSANI